jgi:hypothetical protein
MATLSREEKERAFVAAARKLIGTPFVHQGRVPGVGLDCSGVLAKAADEIGHPYHDRLDYRRMPSGAALIEGMEKNATRILPAEVVPGCAFLFWIKREPPHPNEPRHLAIVSDLGPPMRMIHAYARKGTGHDVGRVEEQEVTENWRHRIHSAWRFREEGAI